MAINEYTCFSPTLCFCIYNLLSLEFAELGAGESFQMRNPVLISGANSWNSKGKVLPEQTAWILDVRLCTSLAVKCHPGRCSPSPSHPLQAGAPGPPLQETEHCFAFGFILCLSYHVHRQLPRTSKPPQLCLSPPSPPPEEAGAPSSLLGQPEKEPAPLPLSQVSLVHGLIYVLKTLPPLSWSSCLHSSSTG